MLTLATVCLALESFAFAQQFVPPREIDPRLGQFTPAPVLRWQRPHGDLSMYGPPFGVRTAGFNDNGNSGVQFAAGGAFQDPFGDQANPGAAPAPATPAPALNQPAPAAPPMFDLGGEQPLPTPQGAQTAPSPSNGRFLTPTAPETPPCDRIYNDRNCCDDERNCERHRDALLRMRITNISVDITPAFRPEAGAFYGQSDVDDFDRPEQTVEESRAARLATAGPRTWRNQQGQVIAEGRWTDYRYGRVYVSRGEGDVVQIPVHELSDDDLCFINAYWNLPSECTLGADPFLGRQFAHTTFTWKASALCHKPLYFEELALERYGHTSGPVFQPIFSGAHFFSSIFFLPYKMGINPPNECIYQLGLYRPGSCAPWLAEPFPISPRGAMLQTGAVLGGVFLLP